MTVTTMNARLARQLEPRAPRPDLRMRTVAELREAGLRAGVGVLAADAGNYRQRKLDPRGGPRRVGRRRKFSGVGSAVSEAVLAAHVSRLCARALSRAARSRINGATRAARLSRPRTANEWRRWSINLPRVQAGQAAHVRGHSETGKRAGHRDPAVATVRAESSSAESGKKVRHLVASRELARHDHFRDAVLRQELPMAGPASKQALDAAVGEASAGWEIAGSIASPHRRPRSDESGSAPPPRPAFWCGRRPAPARPDSCLRRDERRPGATNGSGR